MLPAAHSIETLTAELVDRRTRAESVGTDERGVEDRVLREEHVVVGLELRADVVHVRHVGAAEFVNESEQGIAVEVDPDQRSGCFSLAHVGV